MEDFWLDKAKSDNWSFRFFIRHELKWTIFRMSVCFAPEAVGREYFLGRDKLLSRYKLYARDRATWRAGRRRIAYAQTSCRPMPTILEQRIAHGPSRARLVHSRSARNREIKAGPCTLEPSNRQQASRLRPRQTAIRRHLLGSRLRHRATIVQKKTGRPVQFEITEQSRSSVEAWLSALRATGSRYLFPSRLRAKRVYDLKQGISACCA